MPAAHHKLRLSRCSTPVCARRLVLESPLCAANSMHLYIATDARPTYPHLALRGRAQLQHGKQHPRHQPPSRFCLFILDSATPLAGCGSAGPSGLHTTFVLPASPAADAAWTASPRQSSQRLLPRHTVLRVAAASIKPQTLAWPRCRGQAWAHPCPQRSPPGHLECPLLPRPAGTLAPRHGADPPSAITALPARCPRHP